VQGSSDGLTLGDRWAHPTRWKSVRDRQRCCTRTIWLNPGPTAATVASHKYHAGQPNLPRKRDILLIAGPRTPANFLRLSLLPLARFLHKSHRTRFPHGQKYSWAPESLIRQVLLVSLSYGCRHHFSRRHQLIVNGGPVTWSILVPPPGRPSTHPATVQ
jgi:hypothetical protein